MYYEFPVLSSRDCLMKEPIFPTCPSDDGQRICLNTVTYMYVPFVVITMKYSPHP